MHVLVCKKYLGLNNSGGKYSVIYAEHILQGAIAGWVSKSMNVPHIFASHDRTQARSELDHVFQARRGIRSGWPDTELLLDGGRTLRCELKRPGVRLDEESAQGELLTKLCSLGHCSFWANSVMMYGQQCERFGVPLKGNWRTVAQLADEYVAAQIRKQRAKKVTQHAEILRHDPGFQEPSDQSDHLPVENEEGGFVLASKPTTKRNKPTNPDEPSLRPRPKPGSKRSTNQIMKFEAARMRNLP